MFTDVSFLDAWVRGDTAAARQTFERVRNQYPGTEASRLAEQNLARLDKRP